MDVPSLLLTLPLEVWDRILFWMSLLPIDVANFAKASRLCHELTFGPVGDRNKYNVAQHRALGPLGRLRTPDEVLIRILRINRSAAKKEFDRQYAGKFYRQILYSYSAVPVSRRLLVRAIRWLDKEPLGNFRLLNGLKAFCHFPLDVEGSFASWTHILEGAAAGNNVKVLSILFDVWERVPIRALIHSISTAARSHNYEAFSLLMGAYVKSGTSTTIPLKDLKSFLTNADSLSFEMAKKFLLYLNKSSEKYRFKEEILLLLLSRLCVQDQEILKYALLILEATSSDLSVLFWNTVTKVRKWERRKQLYHCVIELGLVFRYDSFKRAMEFAENYGCNGLLFDLIFRAELSVGEKWKAVWCASEIRSGAITDPENLPRLLDGLLEGGGCGSSCSDFDLAVFGEVMNRLYGGQHRADPESVRPILDAFRPYIYPEAETSEA